MRRIGYASAVRSPPFFGWASVGALDPDVGNHWYVIGYRWKGGGRYGKPFWADFFNALQLTPLTGSLMKWDGRYWQVLKA